MLNLRNGDVSLVLDTNASSLPRIVYWGTALDDVLAQALIDTAQPPKMNSSFDIPAVPSVFPTQADGWSGTPGASWHAGGTAPSRLETSSVENDTSSATIVLHEKRTGARITLRLKVLDGGVVKAHASFTNSGELTITLSVLRILFPIPDNGREILDFTGSWNDERREQRLPVSDGAWVRTGRRGRTGHDSPTLTAVGSTGFNYGSGEIWATHLGWSGNGEVVVERLAEGAGSHASVLGAGEALLDGEMLLAPGDTYDTPPVYFAYSPAGLDLIAESIHRVVRSFPNHPTSPRPLVLNSWEAVYFEHDFARLLELVNAAGHVGVERFVLDDGWFRGRRDDSRGLGDWFVDGEIWPDGLSPLSDAVHAAGMQFGLWFEPEMVNPDSELAREHPEWILADDEGAQPLWRRQQVLNIGNPECYAEILRRISLVVEKSGVDFIKWDHNRDLHEAVDRISHRPGVHRQTLAFYHMVDELRQRHPGLEIESCASGGGRIDLGVLEHCQRVWTADTIDPVERQRIQLGTELIVPLEMMGSHVGASPAHTTERATSLQFRLATALYSHAGIEWDLTKLEGSELDAVTAWAALYKEKRELLHTGRVVHGDRVPDGATVRGVINQASTHALFQLVQLDTSRRAATPRIPLPGLDPKRMYRVRFREDFGRAARRSITDPLWSRDPEGAVLSGALLTGAGVPMPALHPESVLLIEAKSI